MRTGPLFVFPPGAAPLTTPTIPTVEPSAVTAGDTWQWRRAIAGYSSADDWILAYYLKGPGKLAAGITGVAEAGGGWLVTIAPSASRDLVAGAYELHGFVETRTVAGDPSTVTARHRIYLGGLLVRVDPATITTPRKSHTEQVIADLEALLERRIPADREQVSIDGTQITRISTKEAHRLLNLYRERLRLELGGALMQSVVSRDAL